MAILPVYYFPPVSWFAAASRHPRILLEVCQHYHKQEYFNRMRIPGANKLLTLSVPVQRQGERVPLHKSLISYEQDWQRLHWRSIETSYRAAPYFEYYEDKLASVFEQKFDRLIDLNLHVLALLRDILLPGLEWDLTGAYEMPGHYPDDYRNDFESAGKTLPEWFQPAEWTHVFPCTHPDLSALDLAVNLGPSGGDLIKKMIKS